MSSISFFHIVWFARYLVGKKIMKLKIANVKIKLARKSSTLNVEKLLFLAGLIFTWGSLFIYVFMIGVEI